METSRFWSVGSRAAIHVAAVSYSNDYNLQDPVMDFVNHAVVTDAKASAIAAFEFLSANRPRNFLQLRQGGFNSPGNSLIELGELLLH